MARNLSNQQNVDGSDIAAYPNKRIRNNSGAGDGTPVDEAVYGDIHQLNAKMMREAKIQYNNQPDNEVTGNQLYEAYTSVAGKNDLIPAMTVFNPTTLLIPIKITALKLNETLIFQTTFDSDAIFTSVKGSEAATKPITIPGEFKNGDYVRLINGNAVITLIGLYDSSNVPNLVTRLTDLEQAISPMLAKLSIFTVGGAIIPWGKPANTIPAGYQEVVDYRGKTIIGMDTTQTEFAVLGFSGGSKTKTIAKTNLPNINIGVPYTVDYPGGSDNFVLGPGGGSTKGVALGGDGTPLNVLNPYKIVHFIEWATV